MCPIDKGYCLYICLWVNIAEAEERAASDTHSHRSVTDYIHVVAHDVVPHHLFLLHTDGGRIDALCLDIFFKATAVERICDVKRIKSGLGVDLQYLCLHLTCKVHIVEELTGHVDLINIAWSVELTSLLVKCLIIPAPSTDGIAHVHVHHTPWGEHCLLVGIVEVREYLHYLMDALVNMHKVSLTSEGTIFLASLLKASGIEALAYLVEVLLRDALWHELCP